MTGTMFLSLHFFLHQETVFYGQLLPAESGRSKGWYKSTIPPFKTNILKVTWRYSVRNIEQ